MIVIPHKTSDDFFEISFEQNETNIFLNLVSDNKGTYGQNGNQEEIDNVLSHLIALDVARKENIKSNGNIDTPNIEFSIAYGENGKKVEEFMSVPLGMGHFEKGINYLREYFKIDLDTDVKIQKEKTNNRLNKFCFALKIPPKLSLDELDEKGWNTIDKMVELAKALSTPELASFIAGFQGAIRENRTKNGEEINNEKFTQLMATKLNMPLKEAKQIVENSQTKETLKTESKNEVSQEKLEEIKKRSKEAIKNQKKSKVVPKERSNQNPSLGKNL